uniref:Uncharacterized protein n=1 Tax=Anopheles albimanus TaxID=7167 RepID=A0A182FX04_ANOAL
MNTVGPADLTKLKVDAAPCKVGLEVKVLVAVHELVGLA